MDSIDRFVTLLDLETTIEIFCRLQAPFRMPHEADAPGTAWFHLLLDGHCTMSDASGRAHILQAGDFCLWSRGSAHLIFAGHSPSQFTEESHNGIVQLSNDSDGEPLRMLCGTFTARNRAAAGLMQVLPEPLIVPLGDIPQLQALCDLIHSEAQARHAGSVSIIRALSEVLLLLALRRFGDMPHERHLNTLFADTGLARVLSRILTAPFVPYTTEGLAEIACMSRATFARKFQAAAGCGVQTFIRTMKMSAAAKMLRDGKQAVARIAEETGYQSEAAFNNAFKAQFGVTPARFRRQDEN